MFAPRIAVYLSLAALCLGLSACAGKEPAHSAAQGAAPAPGASSSSAAPSPSATRQPGTAATGVKPEVVKHGPRTGNKVALTFDADMTDFMQKQLAEGKIASYANLKILDLLEKEKIPTTFFLTGQWVEQYPDVTRRITGNPIFEVANHSYEHMGFVPKCYTLPQLSPQLMTTDVSRTFDVIKPYGGRQTRYFRFPGGCYDQAALQALAPLGLTVIEWDVVSGDPFATAYKPIVNAVLSTVQAGSIVVLHITEGNAQYTDEAMPEILAGLKQKGLQPVTLSELLGG
ncbi:polysaccharide deacetylase family protein [Virgisporangium aliadipatigenens]|uniref:polysaccharide deacetylase family protein n=1 Tax=Virgisporangium aliadipatigenens TaxID=741659 RepID=UPI001EF20FC3|nr:polysaccharide deacetylase family protein [Virgisporangium aliadipatigenens]